MEKTFAFAGVRIDDYSVREALEKVQTFFEDSALRTIETVTMKTIAAAGGDETVRTCLEQVSLALPGEKEILLTAGITAPERLREVEDREFFYEFLKLAEEGGRSFYVLTQTEGELSEMLRFLNFLHGTDLTVCGSCALGSFCGEEEDLINALNGAMPGVILSTLPTPVQEHFLMKHKSKLLAGIWYGLSAQYDVTESKKGLKFWVSRQMDLYQMRKKKSEQQESVK